MNLEDFKKSLQNGDLDKEEVLKHLNVSATDQEDTTDDTEEEEDNIDEQADQADADATDLQETVDALKADIVNLKKDLVTLSSKAAALPTNTPPPEDPYKGLTKEQKEAKIALEKFNKETAEA